ncbi:CHAT domain-containing protein [Psychroserpens sp. SPM9]|uniref:CHAT domain-containing protein n=1 Tax=Psychroserpens sp. SPM9 TaxID=2975598 RepID=UPI0021A540DD|nr:CHAT domain-containing tetratricopeptide repeat protein [Psychroserpens sp. SPM9]MDG5492527.1 CHAT domain-containing protein [Psychroserpens sp. SPM9]
MNKNIIPFIVFFISLTVFSQEPSPIFKDILESDLSIHEKNHKFDSLLLSHKKNDKLDQLFIDRYEILKWYKKHRNLQKAIILNKQNIHQMDSVNYDNNAIYRKNLYSLGFYERQDNAIEDATSTLKRLLIYDEPDKYAISGAFLLAEIYFFSYNQYHTSKEYFELSKAIAKRLKNNTFIARNDVGIAQSCKLINTSKSLKHGEDLLLSTLEFAHRVNTDNDDKNDIREDIMHSIYNQLGNIYIDRLTGHDFVNGKIYLEKALSIAEKLESTKLLTNTLNDMGVLYLKENKKEAVDYFESALSYKPNSVMKSVIHRNLSIHYLFFKDYDKALEHAQTAIAKLVDLDTSNVNNLPSKSDLSDSSVQFQLISALIDKAMVWIEIAENTSDNKNYIDQALKTFELADFLVEKARLDSKEFKSKLFWRKTAAEIYTSATKASFLANNPEKAFYFIEKNKALLLLEDVSLKISRKNSSIPKEISKQDSIFKHKITKLETLLASKKTDSIQNLLLLAKDDYNEFINALNPNYRLYFKTHKPAEVIDLNTFKSTLLEDGNAYIEYILNNEEGYGIVLTKDATELFEIKDIENLKKSTQLYRNLIEHPFLDKAAIEDYNVVSNTIYKTLFPEHIQTLIKGKKLTILADSYLQNIPFESLQTSVTAKSYLIYKHEISYAYSLSFLNENNKIKRANIHNLVGFAPIEFSQDLVDLPNTEEELNLIHDLFRSKIFLRKKASKERFFKDSKNTKIIHIASHADANDSISPWIAFHNSKVDLKELYSFNNTANLVVLSACNTSLGELNKGEGVMSLSRSFFNTGAHSVLPTLWEVNDKASVELLRSFYSNLEEGQNKSLALHNAKLTYLESNSLSQSSPYYWSSFILIGDTGLIEFNNSWPTYYYFIFIAMVLIITTIILRIKKIKLLG